MPPTQTPATRWQATRQGLPAALLLTLAAAWLLSTLATVLNFGLRYPAFDQYRLYTYYLGLDFPDSALQLENGHRPILPALVRIAEVHLTGADHRLQHLVGIGLALATAFVIARTAWRGRASATAGATAVLLVVLALFWLGAARTLIHSYEQVHIYLVTFCAVLALRAVFRAGQSRPVLHMAIAGLLALAATFSFGSGIASFAAVFVLAALQRLPARSFLLPGLAFLFAIVTYLAGLPGQGGVGDSMALRPFDNLRVLLQWLASPFFHAGLGAPGGWLAEVKGHVAILLGATGLVAWLVMVVRAWRAATSITAAASLALGVATLGLAVGAVIALARLSYFDTYPDQVMADRYLPWPCLFWLGVGLDGVARATGAASPVLRRLVPALAVVLLLALMPSHRTMAGWSAAVHRIVQQSAPAAQLGVWDAERFPREADSSRADVETSLRLMRERRLAMFAEPEYALLQSGWRAPSGGFPTAAGSRAWLTRRFHDEHGQRDVAALEGWLERIEQRPRDALLVIVDAGGAVRGLAKFSGLGPDKRALRLNLPEPRGFDGYVLSPQPDEGLRLLVLDPADRRVLAEVPVEAGTAAP